MDWPGIPATLGVCRPYLGVGGSRFGAILPFYTLGKSSLYSLYQDHIGAVEMELRLTLWAEELIYPPAGCEVFWCYQTWNIQRCFFVGTPAILWVLLQYEVHYLLLLQSPILRWWTAECVDISVFGSGPHLGCFNPIDPSLMVSKPHLSLISPVFVNMHS